MNGYFGRLSQRLPRALIVAAMLVISTLASIAQAGMDLVDPGELPELADDEGLLVVALDSEIPLEFLNIRKDHEFLASAVFRRPSAGHSYKLFRVPVGRYGWDVIRTKSRIDYRLAEDPETHFDVKAGEISYGGDLVFRPIGAYRANIYTTNRGLAVIDWLESEHPQLYKRYALTYSGHYADPFPAFYRETRAQMGATEKARTPLLAPPSPGPLPLPIKTLWQSGRVQQVSLNPAGTLLAVHSKEEDKQRWVVDVVDLTTSESHRVALTDVAFESLQWSGDDTLLLSLADPDWAQSISIVHVANDAAGKRSFKLLNFSRRGRVLDVLPNDPAHILFASTESTGRLLVHKLDVSSQKSLDRFKPEPRERLNKGVEDDAWWLTDGTGNLSVGIVVRDEEWIYLHQQGEEFVEFLRRKSDSDFRPVALSGDGKSLIGLSEDGRAQRDLVEFDIATRKIVRTVFSKPEVDVVGPVMDSRRERPIGARYYKDGQLISEYFEQADREIAAMARKAFPHSTVAVIDQSADAQQLILFVEGSDQTPKIFHLDVARKRAALIEETMPWLASYTLAPSVVVTSKGKDGLPVEAFLTLPVGTGKWPLIVMPHGGPIGVRDLLDFDRDVQFLASLGYAVLRINFRGSWGYGKAFREAGHRAQGTLIEDDIDAAINQAIANYPLDDSRMCAMGFSYGGYSALFAAVRWPDRFRCVISVSGVSDWMLIFSSSDGSRSPEGRTGLEKYFGDPKTQQAQMMETSPLYHFRDLKTPVMLIHGVEDERVDFEHMRRMQRMLDLNGNPPMGFMFLKAGHSIDGIERVEALWTGVAGFLKQNLNSEGKPASSADAPESN